MKRLLLLCLSHFTVLSLVFEKQAIQAFNLGFKNETGSNTTQAQVISFINFINSASTFYRSNTAARLNYISEQMNASFGLPGFGFSIIQQGNDSNNFGWGTKSDIPVYASVASGVDKIWPPNSYMFIQEADYKTRRVFLWSPSQIGNGISYELSTEITKIILDMEKNRTCSCQNSRKIAEQLYELDGGSWNVVCSGISSLFYLSVYTHNEKYMFTHLKNCDYGIYEM